MRANMYRLENVLREGWWHQGQYGLTAGLMTHAQWGKGDYSLWGFRPTAGRRYIRSEAL